MSSDEVTLERIYDEIISMKHHQEEDRFLSKVDTMFTVMVSFMIFVSGLIINNSLNRPSPNLPLLFYGLSAACVLGIALTGQIVAILRDNVALRFFFWAVLINGVGQVSTQAVAMYLMAEVGGSVGPWLWWPPEMLSLVLILYGLIKLEESFFAKFSGKRKAAVLPGMSVFSQLFARRDRQQYRPVRLVYFFFMWMSVALIIRFPQYLLMKPLL